MANRLKLSNTLKELGIKNVYFQPPASLRIKYPCVIYERPRINPQFADNKPYKLDKVFLVTYIDTDPDSEMPDKIAQLPCCIFERHYVSDNLYHDSFRITI